MELRHRFFLSSESYTLVDANKQILQATLMACLSHGSQQEKCLKQTLDTIFFKMN